MPFTNSRSDDKENTTDYGKRTGKIRRPTVKKEPFPVVFPSLVYAQGSAAALGAAGHEGLES
jgi:hypothetical protein